jgi:hypothetical protein
VALLREANANCQLVLVTRQGGDPESLIDIARSRRRQPTTTRERPRRALRRPDCSITIGIAPRGRSARRAVARTDPYHNNPRSSAVGPTYVCRRSFDLLQLLTQHKARDGSGCEVNVRTAVPYAADAKKPEL